LLITTPAGAIRDLPLKTRQLEFVGFEPMRRGSLEQFAIENPDEQKTRESVN
jgi:hypothetical protein